MPIPETRVRLKGFVSLRTVAGGRFIDPTRDVGAQLQEIPPADFITVGAAQQLMINQIREENSLYRQFITDPLQPEKAAKPVETYPGLIRYTLDLKRVDLYDANLFEAFKVLGQNIVEQYRPLILYVDQYTPDITISQSPTGSPSRTLGEAKLTIIPGCWFNSFPIGFDITDTNQAFIAEVEMIAQDVITQ
jgi:hypothetical protein